MIRGLILRAKTIKFTEETGVSLHDLQPIAMISQNTKYKKTVWTSTKLKPVCVKGPHEERNIFSPFCKNHVS